MSACLPWLACLWCVKATVRAVCSDPSPHLPLPAFLLCSTESEDEDGWQHVAAKGGAKLPGEYKQVGSGSVLLARLFNVWRRH